MANVLIIDDDESVGKLLHSQLTEEGHTVRIATDGQEGMAHLQKFQPDLIMLDVFLPDSTGFQVCGQLRKNASTKATPIIMMTGAARFSTQQLIGYQRGANEYIFKPFNIAEVDGLIDKYIGSRRGMPKKDSRPAALTFENPRDALDALAEQREANPMTLNKFLDQRLVNEQALMMERRPEPPRPVVMPSLEGNGHERPAPVQEDVPIDSSGAFVPAVLASKERFIEFGMDIIGLTARLAANPAEKHVSEHLLTTSLGIGQKLTDSRTAPSSTEYMGLLQGALKDIRETGYWLMLVRKAGWLDLLKKPEAIEKTCQSLTTLLADFVTSEKKRLHL